MTDEERQDELRERFREEALYEHRLLMRHWCSVCNGNTIDPSSPCYIETEPDLDDQEVARHWNS